MLKELYIKNLAIIDELQVEFKPGFNVLTGETGAGKSIIIEALGLCLGEKFSSQNLRTGASEGRVELVFSLPKKSPAMRLASQQGLPTQDGGLFIRRIFTGGGRSRAYINGSPVSVSALKTLGDSLLDIHGQHQHQQLLHREFHLDVLDGYGHLFPLRRSLEKKLAELEEVQSRLERLQQTERDRYRTQDLLNYQAQEIEAARLRPGEDGELERKRLLLQNAGKLFEAASQAYSMLYDAEGSASELVAGALSHLKEITELDPQMGEALEEGTASLYRLQEVAERLRSYRDGINSDPARLDQVEDRLQDLRDLKKKYGGTIEEVMAFREKALSQLNDLEGCREEIEALEADAAELRSTLSSQAVELSDQRRETVIKLEAEAERELGQLNMADAFLSISMEYTPDPQGFVEREGQMVRVHPWGLDQVEFLFSANPGEGAKPLAKIASGGEIARVMLALKSILAEVDGTPVLVFDEVDTGIGGRGAEVVGRKLKAVAGNRQVFCVTHLPQIAAMAAQHYRIEKVSSGGRNITTMRPLSDQERIEEIARMSGGERVTKATLAHARDLLRDSK